jgi:hypothetical protein
VKNNKYDTSQKEFLEVDIVSQAFRFF